MQLVTISPKTAPHFYYTMGKNPTISGAVWQRMNKTYSDGDCGGCWRQFRTERRAGLSVGGVRYWGKR